MNLRNVATAPNAKSGETWFACGSARFVVTTVPTCTGAAISHDDDSGSLTTGGREKWLDDLIGGSLGNRGT